MGAMVATIVTALLAAGILWLFAWSVPSSLAQSRLAAYSKSAPFLQVVIYIGGVAFVGRVVDTDTALGTVLVLAIIWCGTVIRETFLRATHYTPYTPDINSSVAGSKSTTAQATHDGDPHVGAAQNRLPGMNTTALLDTMTTLISTHGLSTEPFTGTAPQQTDASSETSQRPSFYLSLSNRADLAQLPSLPLSKRPALGKRTIESLQFRERP